MTYEAKIGNTKMFFPNKELRKMALEIAEAGKKKLRIKIHYTKMDGTMRDYIVSPYKIEGFYLFGTTNKDGPKKIKSFKLDRVKLVQVTKKKFKCQKGWKIEF